MQNKNVYQIKNCKNIKHDANIFTVDRFLK